ITLNAIMAISTLAVGIGSIKLNIALSHMSKLSALSTGILIGTALGVILPEGIQTLFIAQDTLLYLDSLGMPSSFIVGASLLLGFIVLFSFEHILSLRDNLRMVMPELHQSRFIWTIVLSLLKSTLTLGLIIHSFVDGIALGVSFYDENKTFQILFFFMIVIHKLPTAFSLSIVLLREGISLSMCKYHILAFALATPISSTLAYFLVFVFDLSSPFILGILLLISAGTFIFSVLHVMTENS
ncbi:hypothetical protein METBIDRAFT_25434, partial [Metschnikowia bicuspidata var. bicuspidata NRRL YB-4993]